MRDWNELTARSMTALETVAPVYRPTNFWGPGVQELLSDLADRGLETFKSWPTAGTWFYPRYGNGFVNASTDVTFAAALEANPAADEQWVRSALNGALEARRDYDCARLAWDQERWPADLDGFGESKVGTYPQGFRMSSRSPNSAFTRPYLNYLLCLAALSRHVAAPPQGFLEIGGGFGVLGEIVLSRDPLARYVDLDLPPLLTVASYYLTELFGEERVQVSDDLLAGTGPLHVTGSAVLPHWRVADLQGSFDVFVNSYSFQEMEPDVVEHYIDQVARLGVAHVVSLNSREGKPKAATAGEWGALEPVTSALLVELLTTRGYTLVGQYDDPLVRTAAQLNVLTRSDLVGG